MPSVLVLAASGAISAEKLTALPTLGQIQLSDVTIATNSGTLTPHDLTGMKFDTAVSTGPSGHHSISLLGVIAGALAPGGRLIVQESGPEHLLKKNLMLSGFTNPQSIDSTTLAADKPNWETGTKAAITLKKKTSAPAPVATNTWTLNPSAADDDEELVDEDDLLTAEDLQRPTTAAGQDDCEMGAGGKKKACADCTCGRADGEARKLTKEMIENPTSGCGSCALGDAFRCAGCPYQGLPAFEMGKKIELPSDFLLADLE